MLLLKYLKKLLRRKQLKAKLTAKKKRKVVFCKDCRYVKKVKTKDGKELIVTHAKNATFEKIQQAKTDYGCKAGNETEIDFVTGKVYKILRSCKDRNHNGNCRTFKPKWYKIGLLND